jgi:hypothetical protein
VIIEFGRASSHNTTGRCVLREGEAPAEPQLWIADGSTLAAQRELRPPVTVRRSENDSSEQRKRLRAAPLVVVCLTLIMSGCTKHPQVSFTNRHYAAALRTACSAKDSDMLAKAKLVIERDHSAGAIGSDEVESYRSIVATAEAGDWQKAERECHRFQKDQLAK